MNCNNNTVYDRMKSIHELQISNRNLAQVFDMVFDEAKDNEQIVSAKK